MRLIALLVMAAFFLSSCETLKGVGRDLESTGEALEDVFSGG